MGHVFQRIVCGVAALALSAPLMLNATGQTAADAKKLSRNLDELYRAKSSRNKMAMTVKTPHYTRKLVMTSLSRGMDDTLIRILKPRKERGVSTLKRGNEMWNFLPKIRKTIRVPPSMMMGSWMGSDLTNDDLVRATSWERDYTMDWDRPRPNNRCVKFVPKPKAPVTWSRVVACFRTSDDLPTVVEYFDEKNRKARSIKYSQVKTLGGRALPTRMEIIPHLGERKGNLTTIEILDVQWNVPVKDSDFSQAALRRGV